MPASRNHSVQGRRRWSNAWASGGSQAEFSNGESVTYQWDFAYMFSAIVAHVLVAPGNALYKTIAAMEKDRRARVQRFAPPLEGSRAWQRLETVDDRLVPV